jgi:hypothetical protein
LKKYFSAFAAPETLQKNILPSFCYNYKMKRLIILAILTAIFSLQSQAQKTIFETSNGNKTATYFETIDFYKKLQKQTKLIQVKEMGETDAGYPLHIVLVSADAECNPTIWQKQNRVIFFINNSIHPGEPDGVDASMLLVRDIVAKKISLPKNVALAIIPIYNIGGALNRNSTTRVSQNGPSEFGFRGNSQNLDLNRDFTKNDSKESKSFAKIFHWLKPTLFLDNHVSDGADFQHTITLITTQYDKLGKTAGHFLRTQFEPSIYAGMQQKKWNLIPYVEFETANFNTGIIMFNETPRYSSGYAALFNCLSFITETHMLKPYTERVKATYDLMHTFIEQGSKQQAALIANKKQAFADAQIQKSFPLKWVVDTTKKSNIIFEGYEQDTAISKATGLSAMYYNHAKPYTKTVDYYNFFKPLNIVEKPKAYIIPVGWQDVIERLQLNGIQMQRLTKDTAINVTYYTIENYKTRANAYEKHYPHYNSSVSTKQEKTLFLKGDYIIYTTQPHVRYLIEMLEPTGDDSFFAWNFFDAILQQKEGYTDYRWESLAAAYLEKSPEVKAALAQKKKNDSAFANNANAQLDFIYKNSPYYEKAHKRYPVYKLEY